MRYLSFLITVAVVRSVAAQPDTEALWATWRDSTLAPNTRAVAMNNLIQDRYLFDQPDTAFVLAGRLERFAQRHGMRNWVAAAIQSKGGSHYVRGNYDSAVHYFELSIPLFEADGIKRGMASSLGNIANILTDQGDYVRGVEYYTRALRLHEEVGNTQGVGIQLMNIGLAYHELGEPKMAMTYFQRALESHERIDFRPGIADCLVNIGNEHLVQKAYAQAENYFQRSLAIFEELTDRVSAAYVMAAMGGLRIEQGRYMEARSHIEKALEVQREVGDGNELAIGLIALGKVYMAQGEHRNALAPLEEALSIAERIGAQHRIAEAAGALYRSYRALGNTTLALVNHEKSIAARDSIQQEANQRELFRQEYQYQYQKRAFADSVAFAAESAIQQKEIQRQKTVRNGFMGGFGLVALFAAVFFFQRNRIGREKKRSEELLLNILPEQVAEELKAKGEAEAKLIDQVSVLFTDFKGFTAMSEQVSAKQLVHDLHECFSAFDRICERHGIEKIKTIGDAYMAVGGLPTPNTTHATDVITAALEMRDFIAEGKARKIANGLPFFEIRIGVHTGPVVAGIVGVKKFQYDIWGDTVNTAARMESSGEVGKVNISRSTYILAQEEPGLVFVPRGEVKAKGKGELEMWFVDRKEA